MSYYEGPKTVNNKQQLMPRPKNQEIVLTVPVDSVFTESMPYLAGKSGMKGRVRKIKGNYLVTLDLGPILEQFNLTKKETRDIMTFLDTFLNGVYEFEGERQYETSKLINVRLIAILEELFDYLNLPLEVSDVFVVTSNEDSDYDEDVDQYAEYPEDYDYDYEDDPYLLEEYEEKAFQKELDARGRDRGRDNFDLF